jgi:glycosyltransferase involved in cell wall biosynthesis
MQRCDVVLSYSEVELSVVETHIEGRIDILKCPWVVSVEDEVPSFDERDGLSFLGSFNHYPNIEGVKWFANEVVPELAKQAPEIGLSIYGSSMGEEIETLRSHTIDPIGFIPEIAGAFNPHRISVAPLLSGAGIKGKVLSALSHGIPCVLSPMAAEGIGLRHGYDCFIASSVDEWVDAILSLHGDPELWQKISQNSRDYADVAFSFANGRKAMRAVFEAIDLFGSIP